jgi:urease accessory protein
MMAPAEGLHGTARASMQAQAARRRARRTGAFLYGDETMKRHVSLPGLAALLALAPTAVLAHTGHGPAGGFAAGLAHPVGGLDHVLAMLAVGLLAWQLGGRALWLVPASFVAAMGLGGMLGAAGLALPFVETGIGLSIVVLGAAVALGLRAPVAAAMGIAGLFAVFHGHAHGAEMPVDASGLGYGLGFMAATAALHVAGIAGGSLIGRAADRYGAALPRAAGAAIAAAGLGILAGLA